MTTSRSWSLGEGVSFQGFRPLWSVALLLLLVGLFPLPASAQKDTGAIVGTVKDSSGAVIVGAKVTVTEIDRGISFTTASNGAGEYVASPLRIGRYTVTVEKSGFKKSVTGPVTLNVDEKPAVDVVMQVGHADETITVTSSTPLLETETSDLGNTVTGRTAVTLPLNGRNYAQLALLGAGVVPSEPGSRVETSYGFSSNGARSLQNNFLLDGVDNNSNLGDVLTGQAYVIQPSVDAIEEFKVQTNAYSAEFGRGNGAILNAVIKSGTNSFHGDLYEFFRNDALDASNAFDIFGKQPYHQNQFGATLGGPIIKDRTFFFVDYEGLRVIQALPQGSVVPTPQEIGGDFSSLLTNMVAPQVDANGNVLPNTVAVDCNGRPTYLGEIFNTRLTQTSNLNPSGYCGVPIGVDGAGNPTNIFPAGSIDSLAARLAALFPQPNVDINQYGFNFLAEPKRTASRNNGDVRIDHKISDQDSLFGRFSYEDQPSFTPSPFQNALDGGAFSDGTEEDSFRSLALSETHIFTPTLVNEFRFGYNRINSRRLQLNSDQNVSQELDYPGVPFGPNLGGLPQISFSDGTATVGSSGFLPAIEKQNSYVFNENLTWVHGRHSWKFGTEIRDEQFTLLEPAAARGTVSFGSDFTDNPASPTTGGDAVATYFLGIPDSGTITSVHNVDYHRQIYALYAQDDFRMTQRLTFNLGLRYELFTTVKASGNQQANFDFSDDSILVPKGQTAQLTPFLAANIPVVRTGSAGLISPDLTNFAPRLGLAYQITPKLVLRAGYGIFYGGQENGPYSNPSPGFNPPFFVTQSFSPPCFLSSANPSGTDCSIPGLNVFSQGFPANSLVDPNTPLLFSVSPTLGTPYTQQWHLGFQYQLPGQTVFELSYAGSHGSKLYNYYNGNQAVPDATFCTTPPNTAGNCPTAPRRPAKSCDNSVFPPNCNPIFDTAINELRSDGISNYNSLQARLDKNFSHGLQFEVSYTYSHALDDASSANLGSLNNGDFRDQRYPFLEYGNSDFDVRHRIVISYIYQLPFGSGKRFGGNATGLENQIIGNWQVAGITTASTGNWFTITDSLSNVSTSDGGGGVAYYEVRPNVVGNPNGRPCVTGQIFNTCAFVDNTIPFTFGNAGRNIVRGPGFQNWDLSIFKTFPVHEQTRFEFRAEFFNIWNHENPLFESIGQIGEEPQPLEFGTPQFGYPLAARDPRFVQFALKFYF
ncbi:MAG TPA: TonB-dependent receptor [Candidatus Acidoferrum sp.]|nr:TonB-dependent receptor [Candidatus Acidoferrum sp.]